MKLGNLAPPKGAVKKKKRLGIGVGSGQGKTAGKGHKGQKARSGAQHRAWFEGGQMPLHQRLPKVGFNNPFGTVYQVINLSDLARKELSGEITPAILKKAGLISSQIKPVKILGRGDVSLVLQVKVHAISGSAAEKIVKAGGQVELIASSSADG
jgi:large subunit ribosomal protein L15